MSTSNNNLIRQSKFEGSSSFTALSRNFILSVDDTHEKASIIYNKQKAQICINLTLDRSITYINQQCKEVTEDISASFKATFTVDLRTKNQTVFRVKNICLDSGNIFYTSFYNDNKITDTKLAAIIEQLIKTEDILEAFLSMCYTPEVTVLNNSRTEQNHTFKQCKELAITPAKVASALVRTEYYKNASLAAKKAMLYNCTSFSYNLISFQEQMSENPVNNRQTEPQLNKYIINPNFYDGTRVLYHLTYALGFTPFIYGESTADKTEATEQSSAPALTEQSSAPALTEQSSAPALTEQSSAPAVTNEDLVQCFRLFMTMNTIITADLDSVLVATDRIIEDTKLDLKDVFSEFSTVHGEKNKSFQTVSLPKKAKSIFYAKYFKDLYNNIKSLEGSIHENTLNLIKDTNTFYTYKKDRHYLDCVNFTKQALTFILGTMRLIELKSNLDIVVLLDCPNKCFLSILFEELLQPYKPKAKQEQKTTPAPSLFEDFYFSMSIEVPSNVDLKKCRELIQKNFLFFKKQQQQLIQNLLFLNK